MPRLVGQVDRYHFRYVRTNILTPEQFDVVAAKGVDFATSADAGQCLLRIVSDREVNGHSFFIAPRKWAARGYMDLDLEDFHDDTFLQEIQEDQMKNAPVSDGCFLG